MILELSQYTLKISGLKDGNYALKIDGIATATVSAKELAAGVNLTAYGPDPRTREVSPIIAQSRAILAAVSNKEAVVGTWRAVSLKAHAANATPELKKELAALTKKVEEEDEKIRAAAKPKKLHFEISPAI